MTTQTDKEIRADIEKTIEGYKHVLDCYPATIQINAPRALMQLSAITRLDTLYKLLGEERPRFQCDDTSKMNY